MRTKYPYIIISLLISLFIYLFYRTDRTVVNEIIIRIISFDTYVALKESVINFLPLNKFIIYSLPEGLWIFCITLTSKPYYVKLFGRRINCLFIPLVFCISLEICQLLHFTNGRFDLMDIFISTLFWLVGVYTFNDKSYKQNILARLNLDSTFCIATYSIVYLSHVLK